MQKIGRIVLIIAFIFQAIGVFPNSNTQASSNISADQANIADNSSTGKSDSGTDFVSPIDRAINAAASFLGVTNQTLIASSVTPEKTSQTSISVLPTNSSTSVVNTATPLPSKILDTPLIASETITPSDTERTLTTPTEETLTPTVVDTTETPTSTEETLTPTATTITTTSTPSDEVSTDDATDFSPTTDQSVGNIPLEGGDMSGFNGTLSITVPAGALKENVQFTIKHPSADDEPAVMLGNFPFEIDAQGITSSSDIHQFNKTITLALNYSDLYTGPDPNSLTFYYYDKNLKDWIPLPSWVDTKNHILYGLTDHLTLFDYNVNQWQAAELPNMDAAQTSLFTGSASYSVSIDVPAGPGGLQPSLSLNYDSQVVDNSTIQTQAGWVGMGWSLETGYIERNMGGTNDTIDDDTFTLVLNGKNEQLLEATNGSWYTADEDFTKISFDSTNNKWIIYDKTGNIYTFGEEPADRLYYPTMETYSQPDSNGHTCHFHANVTWRWEINRVTNVFNQSLTYSYKTETKDFRNTCDGSDPHLVQIAIYPQSITYPNNHYRVYFDISNRGRTDYLSSWTLVNSRIFYESSRLNNILVQQDTDGNWSTTTDQSTIRKYALTYDDSGNSSIYPGYTWTGGGKDLTLLGVQEFGYVDQSVTPAPTVLPSLPSSTFTYTDNHLTEVDNGYGARVVFTYSQWHETDAGDIRKSDKSNICNPVNGITSTNGWSGGGIYCNDYHLRFTNETQNGSISVNMVQPGAIYEIQFSTDNYFPVSAGFYFSNNVTSTFVVDQDQEVGSNPDYVYYVQMPTNNGTDFTAFVHCYADSSHHCLISHFIVKRVISVYRVTSKSVYDGINANPQVTTYNYDDAATNNIKISAAAAITVTPITNLYYPPLSEYRGNASVAEKGPDGKVTTTFFYQDDARRGQASQTFVSNQSFYDTFDSINTSQWSYFPSSLADHSITRLDGDNALKVNNPASDWSVRAIHQGSSLQDGKMVMVDFQITGTTSKTVLALEAGGSCCSSSYRRLGIVVDRDSSGNPYIYSQYYDGSSFHVGNTLISTSDFKTDTWYVLILMIGGSNSSIHVWQRDNPDIMGIFNYAMDSGRSWLFSHWVWNGTAYMDEYSEGNLYTWNRPTYSVCNPSAGSSSDSECPAAITLATISMPIGHAVGFAVYWVRKTTELILNYEGGAVFSATKEDYKYDPALQGGTQYGNLTNTLEYYYDGSSFILYRGTRQRYYPNTSGVYLVGLSAYLSTFQCSSTCDWSAANLLSSSVNLYDNHVDYSSQPSAGLLTARRIQTSWAGPGATIQNYSDETYIYDSWGNRVKVTKYTGMGSMTALASSGAETTTTCYGAPITGENCSDDGYHTYPLWTKDSLGHVTYDTYSYIFGQPVQETEANNATTTVSYDAFGRVIKVVRPGDTSTSPTIQISYSIASPYFWTDAVQKINSSTQKEIRKFYNGLGELIQTQTVNASVSGNTKDIIVDNTYDGNGNIATQSVPYAVTHGNSYHTPDSSQAKTHTVYDILGRTVEVVATDGTAQVTQYTIDPTSHYNVTHQYDANGNETDTSRDAIGRTVKSVPISGPWLNNTYDALDRLIQTQKIRKDNNQVYTTTTFTYDMAGRKIGMTDPDMGAWTYSYDGQGNLISQTDARQCGTTMTYDALNRVTSKIFTASCNTTNITYSYDQTSGDLFGIGHRTTMVDSSGTTTWSYDPRGRVIVQTNNIQDGNINLGMYITYYSYNSDDSVKQEVLPNGQTVNYTYNNQGLQTSVGGYITSIGYDPASRTTSMAFANSLNIAWTYNTWTSHGGRLGNKTANLGTATVQNLSYSYDNDGNITDIQDDADNQVYNYTYDDLNRLTGAEGRLISNPTATPTVTNTPTVTSTSTVTRTPTITPTSTSTSTSTNTNTPIPTYTPTPTNTPTVTLTPTRTHIPKEIPTTCNNCSLGDQESLIRYVSYSNASVSQNDVNKVLLSPKQVIDPPFYTETAVYDPNNGMITSRNGNMAYTYGDSSHPNAVTGITVSTSMYSSYTYDADGNMITRSITANSVTTNYSLTYDASGNMVAVSGGTVNDRYVYNGDGTLVLDIENGVKTIKLGDFEEVLSNGATPPLWNSSNVPMNSSGFNTFSTTQNTTIYPNVTWRTYYGGGLVEQIQGGAPLGETDGIYYLMKDYLGSTTDVVNPDGTVSRTRYTAWGDVLSSTGTLPTDKQYTGQTKSSNSGLYFYQSRWYDPYLIRWTSPDSIIPNPYNPQSYDRYSYVGNNPINRVDPTGHLDTCGAASGFNEQCKRDNFWTLDQYKDLIASDYGVTLVEDSETWSLINIRNAYIALSKSDDKLNDHLKSIFHDGATFTMASQPQCTGEHGPYDCYQGIYSSTGVMFYVSNPSMEIPLTNFAHEIGHLMDTVPDTANKFSGNFTADPDFPYRNPNWTNKGYVDNALLVSMANEPVQAFPEGESYNVKEYWADAFENYVLGNIKPGGAGTDMYNDVLNALKDYR